jgi:hypothetical protein
MAEDEKEEEKKKEEGGGLTDAQKEEITKKKRQEEEEDDDAIELNPMNARVKKSRIITFYDPPAPLVSDKVTEKDNAELNLIRRWRVEIFNIEIHNMSGDTMNPFVQFIIGGDYRVEYKKTTTGGIAKEEKGEMGSVFKSNVIKDLNDKEGGLYTTHISTEFRATYYEIMRNRLHFEIWTWNKWGLNKFLAIKSLALHDVVTGSINRELYMTKQNGKRKEPVANISFKIKFEEIWDFSCVMLDWQVDDVKKQLGKKSEDSLDTFCRVALTNGKTIFSTSRSETVKNDLSPNWAKFDSGLRFRGTFNDLLSQKIIIKIFQSGIVTNTKLGEKIVNLRSFVLTNIVKTDVLIYETQLASLRGIIKVPKQPRFIQRDFSDDVIKDEYYLVIHLQKLDVFSSLEDRGDFGIFATVEWGGILIRSKTVRSPLINETFHFNIPMSGEIKEDENKLIDFLNGDLRTKSSVRFNVWIDYGDSIYDNVGTSYSGLYNLYSVEADEKTFRDTLERKKVRIMTRIFNGKVGLKSAFNDASSCSIQFGMWFQPDIPNPGVDLSKLYDVKEDQYPHELKDRINDIKEGFDIDWNQSIENNFENEELKVDRLFMSPHIQDQYQSKHLPMKFMSQITSPEILMLDDLDHKNINLRERQIITMSEIAHF